MKDQIQLQEDIFNITETEDSKQIHQISQNLIVDDFKIDKNMFKQNVKSSKLIVDNISLNCENIQNYINSKSPSPVKNQNQFKNIDSFNIKLQREKQNQDDEVNQLLKSVQLELEQQNKYNSQNNVKNTGIQKTMTFGVQNVDQLSRAPIGSPERRSQVENIKKQSSNTQDNTHFSQVETQEKSSKKNNFQFKNINLNESIIKTDNQVTFSQPASPVLSEDGIEFDCQEKKDVKVFYKKIINNPSLIQQENQDKELGGILYQPKNPFKQFIQKNIENDVRRVLFNNQGTLYQTQDFKISMKCQQIDKISSSSFHSCLKITLYFTDKTQDVIKNFEIDFADQSIKRNFQKNNNFQYQKIEFDPNQSSTQKQDILLYNYDKSYAVTVINFSYDIVKKDETQKIYGKFVLPNSLNKFIEYQPIHQQKFQVIWNYLKQKHKTIKTNKLNLNQYFKDPVKDFQIFIPFLTNLNKNVFQFDYDSMIKFGTTFSLNNKIYNMKIRIYHNNQVRFQIISEETQQEMEDILDTFQFLCCDNYQ